ncbi:hypothetical protein WJ63_15140 [Burkholderia pyrrocinia]|nr:hypothetical protein WJ63_15140 [Burkholderia pyrrocinia]
MKIQRLFISDLHLGTREAKFDWLVNFLRHHRAEEIYLVGDIVDIRHLMRRTGSVEKARAGIRALLDACATARVTYVLGNHDSDANRVRELVGDGISVVETTEFVSRRGERWFVAHGHQVDRDIRTEIPEWQVDLTCFFYYALLLADSAWNGLRRRLGMRLVSIPLAVKRRFPSWMHYADSFERAVCEHARRTGYDGVICGHIHLPRLGCHGEIGYRNCGDWVEHCSALMEHEDGTFELLDWRKLV